MALTREEKDKRKKELLHGKVEKKEARRQKYEDKFITDAILLHGGKYDYSLVVGNYVNSHIKVEIICKEHGVFWQKPNNHLQGDGCPRCIGRWVSTEGWKERLRAANLNAFGNPKYTYDDFIFNGSHEKSIVTCPEHGNFSITVDGHLHGSGCPTCAGIGLNTKEWKERLRAANLDIFGNPKYTYDNFIFTRTADKSIVTCTEHGDFDITPSDHKRGVGCPECYNSKAETTALRVLNKHNIPYITQHNPIKPHPRLRFDIFIAYLNLIIELDGAQHEKFIKHFHKTPSGFIKQQERDEIKNKYCRDNPHIHLLRIPHTEFHRIEEIIMGYITNLSTNSKNTI